MRNKKGMYSFISLFFMFFLMSVAVSIVYMNAPNADKDKFQATMSNLTWDSDGAIKMSKNNSATTINFLLYNTVDYFGSSAFEIAKSVTTWASENHESLKGINPKVLLYFIVFILAIPAIYPTIMLIALIVILTKEAIISRREKRNAKNTSNTLH